MARLSTRIAKALSVLLFCMSLFLASAGSAHADAAYVFDPVLSLTGGCSTSALDPVPDPAEPPCPSAEGAHPAVAFEEARYVSTDRYGNIYVANSFEEAIDIFSPEGFFLTELAIWGPESIAVDSEGYLYVHRYRQPGEPPPSPKQVIERFDPKPGQYEPLSGEIAYEPPVVILEADLETDNGCSISQGTGMAVDSEDRLYVNCGEHVGKYGSAAEGNPLLDGSIGEGQVQGGPIAVDSRNGDVYAIRQEGTFVNPFVVRVFSAGPGHPLKRTLSGFGNEPVSVAVNETSGQVLVGDLRVKRKVFVFPESEADQTSAEAAVIEHGFVGPFVSAVHVDNSADSPNQGYLFVPSLGKSGIPPDHIYAFKPIPPPKAPEVKSVSASDIGEDEAAAEATINPGNVATEYEFQYVSQQAFEEDGFAQAVVFEKGSIPAGDLDVEVAANLTGLSPGSAYRVRVLAENCDPEEPARPCTDEDETTFKTFATPPSPPSCPNDARRTGPSAHLPDCRAYELVTPPDTGGRAPISGLLSFGVPSARADGNSAAFVVGKGGMPGFDGGGYFFGDAYVAARGAAGWQTRLAGPNGAQASGAQPVGFSPDHGFAAWEIATLGSGELTPGGTYIRYPDGSFHLVARGSLGEAPFDGQLQAIAEAGSHMVFESATRLEPEAPPAGTAAVYDRTIDPLSGEEETHVVSLLPGELTPEAGKGAAYQGISAGGSAIAFKLGDSKTSPLYLRLDDAQTLLVPESAGARFAGLSEDGRYLFYLLGGDFMRFDSQGEASEPIAASGDVTVVNVSAEGSHAYFVSPSVLSGEAENSEGDKALPGKENLYVWDGEGIDFLGTVTERDVKGDFYQKSEWLDGLGHWVTVPSETEQPITEGTTVRDPSRATPDGTVFIFKSRADLTDYDSGGAAQVYRYDAAAGELRCLSCSPTGTAASGDATLETLGRTFVDPGSVKPFAQVPNLSPDGGRAFFESPDPLVKDDIDGLNDVYEWEEEGLGSCATPGGCLYLISSGQSARPEYLYGVSATGEDVFLTSADLLVAADRDSTPSIYDARVGGGFAEPPPPRGECLGEACQPTVLPPGDPIPAVLGAGNVSRTPRCPKGKRRVRRAGKVRCLKRHGKRHRKAHAKGRTAR